MSVQHPVTDLIPEKLNRGVDRPRIEP
jgi:hypothetical protein